MLQNNVGAECIVRTHWLNIVGATAPTAPMVPTPMFDRLMSSRSGDWRECGQHTPAVDSELPPVTFAKFFRSMTRV